MKSESSAMSFSKNNFLVIGSITLSLFFVIALWNFWSAFIDALGFNMTVFLFGTVLIFLISRGITDWKKQFAWIIPIILIGASFSLWENPYLKIISILLLPLVLSIAFNYTLNPKRIVDVKFVVFSVIERVSLLLKLKESVRLIFGGLYTSEEKKKETFYKTVFGLFLFVLLALVVFIPLLSSADPQFAALMKGVIDGFYDILSFRYMGRTVFAILFSIFIISYFLSFDEKKLIQDDSQTSPKNHSIDSIISGIVLSGVLLLYLIFIGMQFSRLFVDQLPFDFRTTEQLVKSGFWQLIILSIINIIFFFWYFKKTNSIVQNILKAFTVASFLLLLSAGHRMFLYVFFYGLSYEKFFASYTVLYCSLIFLFLAYQLFANREGNLFKYLLFSLLWMYSIATVLPIERFIFNFNASVSQQPDSRIDMDELKMLSYDALPLAVTYRKDAEWQKNWCYWANREIHRVEKKKWYEKNLANFSTIGVPKFWKTGECPENKESITPLEPSYSPPEDTRKKYNDADFSFQVLYPSKEWKVVRIFDYEKNETKGIHIYKNAGSDVTIQPRGISKLTIDSRIKPTVTEFSGGIQGKKTVWENPDRSGMISIKLSSYPKFWNNEHAIEARYTRETKKEVEDILESITWKE